MAVLYTYIKKASFIYIASQFLVACSSSQPVKNSEVKNEPFSIERVDTVSTKPEVSVISVQPQANRSSSEVSSQAQQKLDALAQSFYLPETQKSNSQVNKQSPLSTVSSSKATRLWQYYRQWKGVPYRYGGVNRRGIDCSAFVQNAFIDQFGVKVARTTKDQMKQGRRVDFRRLKVGDMVFFKTGWFTFHNGIYLGNNQFMHASSSKGVTVSKITLDYWEDRFYQARRILN